MTEADVLKIILAALVAGLIGGGAITGTILKIGYSALLRNLEEHFATVETMNAQGDRITGIQKVAETAAHNAEEARANTDRLTQFNEQKWEFLTDKITSQILKPIEKLTKTVDRLSEKVIQIEARNS